MKIKKFNESDAYERLRPKVKHLIEYLQTLDPEMDVVLDKDGWQGEGDTEVELIKTSGLFDTWNNTLIINN